MSIDRHWFSNAVWLANSYKLRELVKDVAPRTNGGRSNYGVMTRRYDRVAVVTKKVRFADEKVTR